MNYDFQKAHLILPPSFLGKPRSATITFACNQGYLLLNKSAISIFKMENNQQSEDPTLKMENNQ